MSYASSRAAGAGVACFLRLVVIVASRSTHQCGTSSTYCPTSMECCASQYSPSTFGCEVPIGNLSEVSAGCGDGLPDGTTLCCKMGPDKVPSTTLKNVLVIGDSVSIGYVDGVASQLSSKALVQHGPWVRFLRCGQHLYTVPINFDAHDEVLTENLSTYVFMSDKSAKIYREKRMLTHRPPFLSPVPFVPHLPSLKYIFLHHPFCPSLLTHPSMPSRMRATAVRAIQREG